MAVDLSPLRELADHWRDETDRLGLDLNRVGRSYHGPYPIHKGEHRNFSVDAERGLFKCFVCGEGGDGIALWMAVRSVSFAEAVQEISIQARRTNR